MEDIERIKERLENIQGVEPIVSSLRTISAGSWQAALRGLDASRQYVEHLSAVLSATRPHLSRGSRHAADSVSSASLESAPDRVLMVVIAGERGLCGAFNDMVLSGAEDLIQQQQVRSGQVLFATFGQPARNYMESKGREMVAHFELPATRVATFSLVHEIGESLIETAELDEIEAVYLLYSPYRAASIQAPIAKRWLPFVPEETPRPAGGEPPDVFIETDPDTLYEATLNEWVFCQLYRCVIESQASEQSARFRAMEAASSNLSRLIEELTLSYHTARQHAITMEMLDLVAGSGALRGPERRPQA